MRDRIPCYDTEYYDEEDPKEKCVLWKKGCNELKPKVQEDDEDCNIHKEEKLKQILLTAGEKK